MNKAILIIIPVYNEEENIGYLLEEMKRAEIEKMADILVINDGSKDDTERVVKELDVNILNKPLNMGYGSTLQLGYKYASQHNYEYIVQIDGDGQHDISNIEVIIDALKENKDKSKDIPDIVIGSRFLSRENEMKVSWIKKIAISFFRKVIKIVTKQEITDPTSGLQGLNRRAFTYYSGYGNFDYRYPDINMIIQMVLMGYKIKEVPAKMYSRASGTSMHSGIFKPISYMVLISLSTISIILRQRRVK